MSIAAAPRMAETPTMMLLGIIEGEILQHLERHHPTSLYRLIQAMDWPASTIMMGVGALIRQGLVRGGPDGFELVEEVPDDADRAGQTGSYAL